MSTLNAAMFIGSHFWFAPLGAAFTSPSSEVITQDGTWPDVDEPLWPSWKLGIVETTDIDPKYGPQEQILRPSPGAVQAREVLIPYAIPEIGFTLVQVPALAFQLAYNTAQIFANATTTCTINGGGGPGVNGIVKCQQYDHHNNLIFNFMCWGFAQLKGSLKAAPKVLTKPELMVTLLHSENNTDNARIIAATP